MLAGIGVGLILAYASFPMVRSQLFGVEPYDPVTLTAATLLLVTAVAFGAAYLPAARASRIDPATALRHV